MRYFWLVLGILLLSVSVLLAQDVQTTIEDVLAEYAEEDGPAVAVQLTTPEGTWVVTSGLVDGSRPTVADDRFRIGSMSKTYVAVVALMLVEDGIFDLDDIAAEWLPDEIVENIANADVVTIRQLLSMRSGIEDYLAEDAFWEAVADDPSHEWTAAEAVQYAYDLPALFAPNAEFYYSNTNYLLLQLVMENATGTPLHQLIRQRLIEPLGLSNTYTQVSESMPGGFVDGWGYFNDDLENLTDVNDGAGLADGGIISTVGDVTAFYQALLQEQSLLDDAMMSELLNFVDDGEGAAYSLGLNLGESDIGPVWGHTGSVLGFMSAGSYLPEEDVTIIVLSATEDIDPEEVAEAILEAVLD